MNKFPILLFDGFLVFPQTFLSRIIQVLHLIDRHILFLSIYLTLSLSMVSIIYYILQLKCSACPRTACNRTVIKATTFPPLVLCREPK